MKDFICTLLRTISLLGGFAGALFVMNGAIEKPFAFMIMFGGMFLWFLVDSVEEYAGNEGPSNTDERKEK